MSEVLAPPQFDRAIREYDDISTWLAEVLDGAMYTEFKYEYDGLDLRARDGSALAPIFTDAIESAEERALDRPETAFEVRRRHIELEEYQDMLAMARFEAPNTMVVLSDFPPELMHAQKDQDGYNVTRKQTMMRVVTRNNDGSITMASQSLDQSDRKALEAIYEFMGSEVHPGELLGQRIMVEADEEFQGNLVNTLRMTYDQTLEDQYGGSWFAGRSDYDRRNTMDFALQQHDLIEAYLAGAKDGSARYNLAAAMSARFDKKDEAYMSNSIPGISHMYAAIEMEQQGRLATKENKTFSGCGVSEGGESAEDELSELGYGGKSKEELSWHGGRIKKGTCINCHEGPKDVGVKDWCRDCIKGHCG